MTALVPKVRHRVRWWGKKASNKGLAVTISAVMYPSCSFGQKHVWVLPASSTRGQCFQNKLVRWRLLGMHLHHYQRTHDPTAHPKAHRPKSERSRSLAKDDDSCCYGALARFSSNRGSRCLHNRQQHLSPWLTRHNWSSLSFSWQCSAVKDDFS